MTTKIRIVNEKRRAALWAIRLTNIDLAELPDDNARMELIKARAEKMINPRAMNDFMAAINEPEVIIRDMTEQELIERNNGELLFMRR